jgi:glycosyltransferase involved in cell wall biosynthesis
MQVVSPFTVVVPTRNSSNWIIPLLKAYRKIDIEPLYIVDSRSSDETLTMLQSAKANIRLFEPSADFVEAGMQAFAAKHVSTAWTLRLDDDEFPSLELVRWAKQIGAASNSKCWALSRRDLIPSGERITYSKHWSMFFMAKKPGYLNPQMRLYRHDLMEFTEDLHTPGFTLNALDYAPQEAYFVHFDVIVRSIEDRIAKIRKYEKIKPGFGWKFGNQYLPELVPEDELDLADIGTAQFNNILLDLPFQRTTCELNLSADEIRTIRRGFFDQIANARRARAERLEAHIPSFLMRKSFAELLCTISGFHMPSGLARPLHDLGSLIYARSVHRHEKEK